MTVKCPLSIVLGWLFNVRPNLSDDGRTPRKVRNEMPVPALAMILAFKGLFTELAGQGELHNIDMEPVGALGDGSPAVFAQIGEVSGEN